MTATKSRSSFWKGLRDGMTFLPVIIPFGLLFGVVGTEVGLEIYEIVSFSIVVIAGAAQFTALQLMVDNAPTVIVLLSALAVNLRLAMYSAAIMPYLGAAPLWRRALIAYVLTDQSYALCQSEFETKPELSISQRALYFFGTALPIVLTWFVASYAGAALGTVFPPDLPLDFALPITFLAMVGPMLRTAAHVSAAITAIVVSLLAVNVPHSLGILIGGVAGMVVGAQIEYWLKRSHG